MKGHVSIVGAGPGDPELLTVRAVRALSEADLVLYDALVPPEIVALAARAQRFSVGKRAGRASFRQETIHTLMIRAARRGKHVVRLKGGDPFVFGRGGEEILALRAAGIPHEVVPGISSALAAPALAGIPVTHRGLAAAFAVVSGHAKAAWQPVLGGLSPNAATVVVLMGLSARAEITASLLERGWAASTPAAVLLAAGTPRAHTWTGSLRELGSVPVPETLEDAPGTIVVGDVVTLATTAALSDELEGDARALTR
ncbi:MAG TPA: uroporphyrinogen-III C-methyltransferase [Vicinamibacteria bacterium]|nr:uroporphyrinogen-III C-methyltransferase [Vicinamibacteria bacterium]